MCDTKESSEKSLEKKDQKYGIVVLLDALGVSNYRIDEAIAFIKKRNELINQLESLENGETAPPVKIATFGDTIVFTWETGMNNVTKMLPIVGKWMRSTIRWGIANEILLRGSISIGEYIADKSTILGPAIADAAAWYNEAEWFGVILTPKSQLYYISLLEKMQKNGNSNDKVLDEYFVNFSVPTKNGRKDLWAVSWPYDFYALEDEMISALGALSTALWYFPMPKGTETKYENSIVFFKWYGEKVYPSIKRRQILTNS